jgi:guanine nucleotide-binding protein subunit alpha
MKLIYAQGFSKTEKLEWKPVVFNNIVQSFRLIFDAMNDLGLKLDSEDNEVSELASKNLVSVANCRCWNRELRPNR